MITHTILYVANQRISRDFYTALLKMQPILDVEGMTEFELSESHILGLMPEKGIKKLLGDKILDPALNKGVPRAELYFRVNDIETSFNLALELGANELSPILDRDWGDKAGYVLDPDGYVLAFAKRQSL